MARYYHLRYDRSKKDAEDTVKSITKHLKQFGLPTGVKIKPRPDLKTHGIGYEILTRATPKQIDLLHVHLNRDTKWDRRMLVSKKDIKEETDPKFKKHLSKIRRNNLKDFKAQEKMFKTEFGRIAGRRKK